jgi:hypothetical protein
MEEYLAIIGLIIGASYWIVSPLLRSDQFNRDFISKTGEALRQLELKKENVYATIQELEFDLNMGKLSKEDFANLKEQYKKDAVDCLKTIDELQMNNKKTKNLSDKDLEKEIEKEISALRSRKSEEKTHIFCTQCGTKASHQDLYCFACGAKLVKPDFNLPHI